MNRIILWTFGTLVLIGSCSPGKPEEKAKSTDPGIRVVKEFYPDGGLRSETEAMGKMRHGESKEYRKDGTLETLITYENNRKHGRALSYYSDGETIKIEMNYVSGYKHGVAKWYYKSGKIYRNTPFIKGKIHGTRITYYENGCVQAKIPYQNGHPGMGLKELYPNGNPREFNAGIIFKEKDRINLDNTFRLSVSLSDGSRNVEFYSGKLSDGKYWNEQLSPIPTENGIGVLDFYVSKGSFKMETINVVARVTTSLKNYHIIQREYHLALENKF